MKHLHNDPVPPTKLRPEIRAELELIVLRALHKQPELRWQRMKELAEVLRKTENNPGQQSLTGNLNTTKPSNNSPQRATTSDRRRHIRWSEPFAQRLAPTTKPGLPISHPQQSSWNPSKRDQINRNPRGMASNRRTTQPNDARDAGSRCSCTPENVFENVQFGCACPTRGCWDCLGLEYFPSRCQRIKNHVQPPMSDPRE